MLYEYVSKLILTSFFICFERIIIFNGRHVQGPGRLTKKNRYFELDMLVNGWSHRKGRYRRSSLLKDWMSSESSVYHTLLVLVYF